MQYGKTLKILICLLLIIPLFNIGQASANTNYDHQALMEYEGYGQAMYESIVEQTTFITGQYTDNKEYVSNSIDQIKDYASFWYNEFAHPTSGCPNGSFGETVLCGYGNLFERGGAYFLTVGDWFKNLFGDYGEEHEIEGNTIIDNAIYSYSGGRYTLKTPYFFDLSSVKGPSAVSTVLFTYSAKNTLELNVFYDTSQGSLVKTIAYNYAAQLTNERERVRTENLSGDLSRAIIAFNEITGGNVTIFNSTTGENVQNGPVINPDYSRANNYINNNPLPTIPVPKLQPTLVCPDGNIVKLSVNGSTFLSNDGSVMSVNKDGTASLSGVTCNLNWEKPTVDYVDDKIIVTDSDGNLLDLLTGLLTNIPDEEENNLDKLEPLDNSLLEYVKNAYQYGTNFLKTATDGLKSLAIGARDLTGLFGIFFSWLPSEMVVLMSSGLGIVIGLRLFRK